MWFMDRTRSLEQASCKIFADLRSNQDENNKNKYSLVHTFYADGL